VDGRPFELDAKSAKPAGDAAAEAAAAVVGTWSYVIEGVGISGTMTLSGTPDDLTGTFVAEGQGEVAIEDAILAGMSLSFSISPPDYGRIDVIMTIDGDTMEGTMDVPGQGTAPISASRLSGPTPD
jgi:hypothetical protein